MWLRAHQRLAAGPSPAESLPLAANQMRKSACRSGAHVPLHWITSASNQNALPPSSNVNFKRRALRRQLFNSTEKITPVTCLSSRCYPSIIRLPTTLLYPHSQLTTGSGSESHLLRHRTSQRKANSRSYSFGVRSTGRTVWASTPCQGGNPFFAKPAVFRSAKGKGRTLRLLSSPIGKQ